jgi:hypothetical protein
MFLLTRRHGLTSSSLEGEAEADTVVAVARPAVVAAERSPAKLRTVVPAAAAQHAERTLFRAFWILFFLPGVITIPIAAPFQHITAHIVQTQSIVSRMAANTFQVKTWLIGILSALVVVESKSIFAQAGSDNTMSVEMNLFLFLPILCFWYLDAFFLSTEKLYRELYKWVVQNRPVTDKYLYDLNTFKRKVGEGPEENLIKPGNSIGDMMVSKTLLPFYLMPMIFVLGLLFYNFYRS